MLNFSFSSLFMALITSSLILLILLCIFLYKKNFLSFGIGTLGFFMLLIISRLLFPFEFPIATNIYWPESISKVISWFLHPRFPIGNKELSCWDLFVLIWFFGFLVSFGKFILSSSFFHQFIQSHSQKIPEEDKRCILLKQLLQHSNIKKRVNLLSTTYFNTPIVYHRHMHYWILWPEDLILSDKEQFLVLKHELAHIYHHDLIIKNIIYFLSIFYWWNPLGSYIRKKADLLLELRVDKSIAFSSQEATIYLECLLKIFQKSTTNFSAPSGIGFCSTGKSMIIQRFYYLTNDVDKKMSIRGLVMKLFPIILSIGIYVGSYIFILEASYIPQSVKESTLQLTSENSYAVIYASGSYDIYICHQYVETVTSMKYYTDIQKIYSSYKEFYDEN